MRIGLIATIAVACAASESPWQPGIGRERDDDRRGEARSGQTVPVAEAPSPEVEGHDVLSRVDHDPHGVPVGAHDRGRTSIDRR
jgi:hypothetical protein